MPGKMENKIKEILEHSDHLQSEGCNLIVQSLYELARHIDEVEKQTLGPVLSKKPYPLPPHSIESQDTPPTPEPDPSPDKEIDLSTILTELHEENKELRECQDIIIGLWAADRPEFVRDPCGIMSLLKDKVTIALKLWRISSDSKKKDQPTKETCKECGIAAVQHPKFPGNPKS